ncbi:MAG: ABC-2 family transporter protein [Spirochaetales bacterium]|nr:ABC-2 family transporter protein [Spirochaetales bacterium]
MKKSPFSFIHVYLISLKNALSERMVYRGDFFISSVIALLFEFVVPMITLLIYSSGSSFPGWTMNEALLIQAIFLLAKGIAFPFFFGIVFNILILIREGSFDILLLKPRSILFLSIATAIDINSMGKLLGGIGFFVFIITRFPSIGPAQWAAFGGLFLLSLSVFFSFALFLSGTLFVWVGNSRMWEIFNTFTLFGMYPQSIYSQPVQILITTAIPVALLASLPASVLLGKEPVYLLPAGIVAGVLLCAGILFWHGMLRRYTSAGG